MRLKARSSRLTFAFFCRLQSTSSEFWLALSSAACVWTALSSGVVLDVASTGSAVDPKVRQLRTARARSTPQAHKQSHRRSSTIPRTPRWSCCGVLMGSTCAEQARCAEVKVRTLSPIPPQRIAACRLTLRRTSWRLPASSIQLVRCRLSRPHQVSCSATTSSQQTHTQHAGRRPSRSGGI
jgi:hypothetical protein